MSRLAATLRRDVILQHRYRLYAVSVFVVMIWGGLLALLPQAARAENGLIVPAFLLLNFVLTTYYFTAALVLLEKNEGMPSALAVTPLRNSEYLVSKASTLTCLAAAESLLVALPVFGAGFNWAMLLCGCAALGALYSLLGFITVAAFDSVNRFLMPSAVVVALMGLPLLSHFGWTGRWTFFWHPLEPAMTLLRAAYAPPGPLDLVFGLAGSLVWAALCAAWAGKRFDKWLMRKALL